MAIVKTVIRLGVIGGLATGAAVVVAGPHRVAALAGQARQHVINTIDSRIDDPVVLRSQLKQLEQQYPARIAEVASAIAQLDAQAGEIRWEQQYTERAIEFAMADREHLRNLLAEADAARASQPYAVINVRFDNRAIPLEQAYARAAQVNQTIAAFHSRADAAAQTLELLSVERERMTDLLAKLETERADFQSQLVVLDSRIDSLARKERMVEMVEKRRRSLDNMDRFASVHSFNQVMTNLSKAEAEIEARFQNVAHQEVGTDYESRAKAMLNAENAAKNLFERTKPLAPDAATIEIGPPAPKASEQRAQLGHRILIE